MAPPRKNPTPEADVAPEIIGDPIITDPSLTANDGPGAQKIEPDAEGFVYVVLRGSDAEPARVKLEAYEAGMADAYQIVRSPEAVAREAAVEEERATTIDALEIDPNIIGGGDPDSEPVDEN